MKKIFTLICTILIAFGASASYTETYNYKCGPTEVVVTDLSTPTDNKFKLVIAQRAKNTNSRSPAFSIDPNTVELILKPEQHSIVGTFTTDDYSIDANSFLTSGSGDTRYVSHVETSTITIVSKGDNKYAITDGLLQVESSDGQILYKYNYCYDAADLNDSSAPKTPFEFTFEEAPQYKYTTYENWQIKYEGSEWENMTKVEEGLFKLVEINWETRFGFNVKSDDNPIKKDWYDPDDPDVVIGEEVTPPIYADVYLRVIDDETLKIGIGVEPPIQFVDTASGLKFEITSMEEPRTVKVINNEYPGTSYTVPGTVTYWGKTFDVTEIGVEAFHDCPDLESITLPESVTTLAYASLATSGLKSITIPATVTKIGEYAFAECPALQSVTFEGNACQDAIGDNAFYYVGTTTTPATLTLPDDWAGSTPENSETPWYGGYFDYTAPGPRVGGKFVDETSGLKFEITSYEETSKTVKVIANSYTGASYDIPETVTNWEVTFDVTEIDAYAFAECHLETFTVPASIVKIGAGAFSNCTSLQSVTFKGNACQNGINVTAFYGVGEDTPATLTLPDNWTGAKPEQHSRMVRRFLRNEQVTRFVRPFFRTDGCGVSKYGYPCFFRGIAIALKVKTGLSY